VSAPDDAPARRAQGGRVTAPLLQIDDLHTVIELRRATVQAVDGVSLVLQPGEALALVGESGSGKSMLCHSIVRLEPQPAARIAGGRMLFDGIDLAQATPEQMRGLRGRRIGMVLQDPLSSLNPVLTIGAQLVEALALSSPQAGRAELRDRAAAALERVGIHDGARRLDAFPFEFSGGMRQRVVAAIAVAREPALLIADEPTTALDVTTQARFLALLRELRAASGMGLLLVTHDLGIVGSTCDRIAVMYAGRIVEIGAARTLLEAPRHPYTRALLRALPTLEGPRLRRMVPIAGEPPLAGAPRRGCRFAPRCEHAAALCTEQHPPRVRYADGAEVSCWLHVDGAGVRPRAAAAPPVLPPAPPVPAGAPLLELRALSRRYPSRRGRPPVDAVSDVSLALGAGESVGIAGESGSGKTTLTRIVLQLVAPSAGAVLFDGQPLRPGASRRELAPFRRSVQAVLQDSSEALDSRMRIRHLVAEPLVVQQPNVPRAEVDARVAALLQRVGLSPTLAGCYPHELSGGQKQRVAIARSLIVGPRLLVLDEPVSALDVSVRSQVLNLLLDLKDEHGLTLLIVAHDLAVLRHVTDRLFVMHRGRVVEQGPTDRVLGEPAHDYTRALVAASPGTHGPVARVAEPA
jgi:peptide/nickel transport system ATP-binding protein